MKNEIFIELIDLLNKKRLSEIFEILQKNPDIDINMLRNFNKTDILLCAILLRKRVFVDSAIKQGFNLEQNSILYLHHGLRTGDSVIINLLLDEVSKNPNSSSEVNKKDKNNLDTIIHVAIDYKISKEILKRLTLLGASWVDENNQGVIPIYQFLSSIYYVQEVLDNELIDLILSSDKNYNFIKKNDIIIMKLNELIKINIDLKDKCEYLLERIK